MKKILLILSLLPLSMMAQNPGDRDVNFNSGLNDYINDLEVNANGIIYASVYSNSTNSIARISPDGTILGYTGPDPLQAPLEIILQPDGKLLMAGGLMTISGTTRNYLARLNPDNTLDTGFDAQCTNPINAIALQPDGKILVGGNFTVIAGVVRNNIARLNADGTIDNSFVIGNGFDNYVTEIAIQSDGKILVSGEFLNYDGVSNQRIIRLNADGSIDNTFNASLDFPAKIMVYEPNTATIMVGGDFTYVNATAIKSLVRLNNDGTTDNTFTSGFTVVGNTIKDIYDRSYDLGYYMIAGDFTAYGNINGANYMVKIDSDGTLDAGYTFNMPDAMINSIVPYSYDKVYAGGQFTAYQGTSPYLARVYNQPQAIEITPLTDLIYCTSDSIYVSYTLEGTFNSGNIFSLEISDSTGSFATPNIIGALSSNTAGTIAGSLSALTPANGYRVRIKSDNPVSQSPANYDDINIIMAITSDAGTDIISCNGQLVNLSGTTNNATTVNWTSNGTGTFSSTTVLSPTYTPGASDYTNGEVKLALSAGNTVCSNITDTIKIEFGPLPAVLTTDPSSVSICEGGTAVFGIAATNAIGYEWWISTDAGINWYNLAYWGYHDADYYGYDTPQLTIQNATYGISGYRYRCVALSSCATGSDTSAAAVTTVNTIPTVSYNVNTIPLCGDSTGSITANVFGRAPFGLVWNIGDTSSTINNLPSGEYRLQVIDNVGCTYSGSTYLTSNNGPIITLNNITDINCNGGNNGAISVTVSGGTSPYTYEWSSGDNTNNTTNLTAGTYELTVQDNAGCASVASYTVNEPTPIIISFSESPTTCGSATGILNANVSGGTPNYSYLWDSNAGSQTTASANNLNAGIYTITVTDANNCVATASGTVSTDTPGPDIVIDSVYSGTCTNPAGAIYTTIDNATTIQWSTGASTEDITGLLPGTYYLIATGSTMCVTVKQITVNDTTRYVPEICMVTVDNNTFDNKIVWEKVAGKGIQSYNIYSENNMGTYQLIANVPYTSFSEYTHVGANPNVKSWKYKISSIDSCGTESAQSPHHKTIHLYSKVAGTDSIKVTWDNYQGFNYANFTLLKSDYPYTTWQTVTTVAYCGLAICQNTYIDYPADTSTIYIAEIDHPVGCNPSKTSSKTRSNIRSGNSRIISSVEWENTFNFPSFEIYPNPANESISISIENNSEFYIAILNTVGTTVYNGKENKYSSIPISNLPAGIYIVELDIKGRKGYKKLIIN